MGKNNSTESEIFLKFLKENGLSYTRPRKRILEQIFMNHDHFDAEDIVEALRKRNSRVSRATVYRTLVHLEDCSLIRRVDLGHEHSHFEHTLGHKHHEHLYCKKCGNVIEFTDSILENRINKISELNRFNVINHTVQIFGICENCRKKR